MSAKTDPYCLSQSASFETQPNLTISGNTETDRIESDMDREYATGLAPNCTGCGRPIRKAEVVWGKTTGAWHPVCIPTFRMADGTVARLSP